MINRRWSTFKIQLEQEEQERIGNKVKLQKEIPFGEASDYNASEFKEETVKSDNAMCWFVGTRLEYDPG